MAFGVIQGRLWRSPSVRGLSDAAKLAWNYLLGNDHGNMLGYYRVPLPYMADDLEWTEEKARETLSALEKRGLIAYDQATCIVFILHFLKFNKLSAGDREKGAMDRLRDLPSSPLYKRLYAAVNEWAPGCHRLLLEMRRIGGSDSLFGGALGDLKESSTTPRGETDTDIDVVVVRDVVGSGGCGGEEGGPVKVSAERIERDAVNLLNDLCERTGAARFREGHGIKARVAEGATHEDILLVVHFKFAEWFRDPKMTNYLRPKTIFGTENFPGYLGAARQWERSGRPALDPKESAARGTTAWLNGDAGGPPQEG